MIYIAVVRFWGTLDNLCLEPSLSGGTSRRAYKRNKQTCRNNLKLAETATFTKKQGLQMFLDLLHDHCAQLTPRQNCASTFTLRPKAFLFTVRCAQGTQTTRTG